MTDDKPIVWCDAVTCRWNDKKHENGDANYCTKKSIDIGLVQITDAALFGSKITHYAKCLCFDAKTKPPREHTPKVSNTPVAGFDNL